MGRPRAPIDPRKEGPELLKLFRKEKGWKRERLLALKLAMEGKSNKAVSIEIGRSHQTVQDWINRFRDGGIALLLTKEKGNGPESRLTAEMREALSAELAKGKWRRGREAWQWLCENYDMGDLKPHTVYHYLGKCGGRLKVTRPSNPKKDPEKEQEFREHLADKLKDLNLPQDRPVRLWVYDEMRYGLHPLTRRMWSLRGVRALAPSRRRYENGYIYGALQVGGAGSEFLFTPNLNQQWDKKFLSQISRRDPYATHVVIGDGAGFHHRDGAQGLPSNIRLLTLPPYCPELNPIEKLWDIVKDGICNRDWKDLRELEDRLEENLLPYWQDAKKVFSLIGGGYLASELNAS